MRRSTIHKREIRISTGQGWEVLIASTLCDVLINRLMTHGGYRLLASKSGVMGGSVFGSRNSFQINYWAAIYLDQSYAVRPFINGRTQKVMESDSFRYKQSGLTNFSCNTQLGRHVTLAHSPLQT